MDTDIFWTLRGNYEEKKEKLSKMSRAYLEAAILDTQYNNLIREMEKEDRENGEKIIPYFGWYWRHVTFSQLNSIKIGNNGSFTGIIVNNKWDHPERYMTKEEARILIGYLDRVMRIKNGDESGNIKIVMQELWDYMQTLKIPRKVMESYAEGQFTKDEAQEAVATVKKLYNQEYTRTLLDYERLDSDEIWKHIKTSEGEHVIVRSAFRWLIDGEVIPNAYECHDLEDVCSERNWSIVCSYGLSLAVIRKN